MECGVDGDAKECDSGHTKQCNLWVPAMVLALENLSCSKVSSLPHSSVVMNLKVIPCNWVCFVPVDTSTLQVLEYSASCDFCTKAVQRYHIKEICVT